jgi:hypothetical protein
VKWGFKAEAERMAVTIRGRVDLDDRQRLDLPQVREHLDVSMVELSALTGCEDAVAHLHDEGVADFSAALVLLPGGGRLIIVNDRHSDARLANSVAHELSHLLLDHTPTPGFDPLGNRDWREDDEAEADWLAGCLLAPRSGLMSVVTDLQFDLGRAAGHYGISDELMRQRWHQTGCARQAERARKRRLK